MEQLSDRSTDRPARTDAPDTPFYLPGMPRSTVESSRVVRYLATLFPRHGVLPADLLRER